MSALPDRVVAAPINPLGPLHNGSYVDDLVSVTPIRGPRPLAPAGMVRTRHFDIHRRGKRIEIAHAIAPQLIDDHLSAILSRELFEPGWVCGLEVFERIYAGIVRTVNTDAVSAWTTFYNNSLRRSARRSEPGKPSAHDQDLALVRGHLGGLLRPGSLLDMGSCFGFLAIELARSGREVTASDMSEGTMQVLAAVTDRLRINVQTLVGDAAHLPLQTSSFANVTALHLLEHVDADHGEHIVHEAMRIASERAIIAVPLEEEPNETYGHVRTISLVELDRLGARSGRRYEVHEHHGGWLTIDTGLAQR